MTAVGFDARPVSRFEWHAPTRIVHGSGRVAELPAEVLAYGERVLVVTDETLERLGVADRIEAGLLAAGCAVARFSEVRSAPERSTARDALASLRDAGATVVVGLGGGSVMDVAKVAAAAATNPDLLDGSGWDREGVVFLRDDLRAALPVVQVPTTVSSGSEVNGVASLRHGGAKRLVVGDQLRPRTAVLDPDLTASLPPRLLASGAVETIGRVLCPCLADEGTRVGDELAAGLLRATLASLEDLRRCGPTLTVRSTLAWAATTSMTRLADVGRDPWAHVLWYVQNGLGSVLGWPKGDAMAALLPRYLRDIVDEQRLGPVCGTPERLAMVAEALGCHGGDTATLARSAVRRVTTALAGAALPTRLDVDDATIDEISAETTRLWGGSGFLAEVRPDQIEGFLRAARWPSDPEGMAAHDTVAGAS